jgi:hypothetical protein
MTGTLDGSPIGEMASESRRKVFPLLVNTRAWQVVFDKATHMSFGEREKTGLAAFRSNSDPRYHKAILALSTAFWDMTLKNDPAAKTWLNGPDAKSVLVAEDKWERNGK